MNELVTTELHTTFIISLVGGRELRLTNVTREEAEVIAKALLEYYIEYDLAP